MISLVGRRYDTAFVPIGDEAPAVYTIYTKGQRLFVGVFEGLGVLQDVVSRTDGRFGESAQHLGQFERARLASQSGQAREGAVVFHDLLNLKMQITKGSQLRKMRDDHHLVGAPQAPKFFPDRPADAPADALIYLVEDQGGDLVGACQHVLQGQHQARGLAARGDFYQRLEAFPGVGLHQELDLIQATPVEGNPRAVRQRQAFWVGPGLEIDRETGGGHVQVVQFGLDGLAHFFGGCFPFF